MDWVSRFGNSSEAAEGSTIDCGFAATGASFDTFAGPGKYTFGPPENALAHSAFRLLWKLQSLATVPAVDWMAYANQSANKPASKESSMFNYNEQIQAYEADCVNLPQAVKDKFRDHREANRNRLKRNRPGTSASTTTISFLRVRWPSVRRCKRKITHTILMMARGFSRTT